MNAQRGSALAPKPEPHSRRKTVIRGAQAFLGLILLVPTAKAGGEGGGIVNVTECRIPFGDGSQLVDCRGYAAVGGSDDVPSYQLPVGVTTSPGCGGVKLPLSNVFSAGARAPDPAHCMVWVGVGVATVTMGEP